MTLCLLPQMCLPGIFSRSNRRVYVMNDEFSLCKAQKYFSVYAYAWVRYRTSDANLVFAKFSLHSLYTQRAHAPWTFFCTKLFCPQGGNTGPGPLIYTWKRGPTTTDACIDECLWEGLRNTYNSSLKKYKDIFISHNLWREIMQRLDEEETMRLTVRMR